MPALQSPVSVSSDELRTHSGTVAFLLRQKLILISPEFIVMSSELTLRSLEEHILEFGTCSKQLRTQSIKLGLNFQIWENWQKSTSSDN